jgi:hypothetical protein
MLKRTTIKHGGAVILRCASGRVRLPGNGQMGVIIRDPAQGTRLAFGLRISEPTLAEIQPLN